MAYISMKQAADMTGLSEKTIQRYADSGKVQAMRLTNGRRAILEESLPRRRMTDLDMVRAELELQLGTLRHELTITKARLAHVEAQLRHSTSTPRPPVLNFNKESPASAPAGTLTRTAFNRIAERHGVAYSTAKGWDLKDSDALESVESAVRWIVGYVFGEPVRRRADRLHQCVEQCGHCADLPTLTPAGDV